MHETLPFWKRESAPMRPETVARELAIWLRQGISPRRLALTLALGFTIGCLPVVGVPTLLCTALAVAFGLNLPAIQAANYAAMPFQLMLIVPFLKLGSRFWALRTATAPTGVLLARQPLTHLIAQLSGWAGQAMVGWLLVALPAVAVITAALTLMLRRIPALREAEAGD